MKIRGLEITRTEWLDKDTFLAVTEEKQGIHYEARYHVGDKRLSVYYGEKALTELRDLPHLGMETLMRFMLAESGIMPKGDNRIIVQKKIEVNVYYSVDLDASLGDVSSLVDNLCIKVTPNGTETDKAKLVGVNVKKR